MALWRSAWRCNPWQLGGRGVRCNLSTSSTCRDTSTPPRVCVVGGGPAGFFTAHQLLKLDPTVEVDVIEQLPVPYGLVRFGVAPDHPEVKNVTETFETVATNPRCSYYGNLSLGADLSLEQLRGLYTAVVLAYGCSEDRRLGVSGEDLPGVYSARDFVNWYNGHPDALGLDPLLQAGPDAVIFGQGNVALDVARVLLAPIDHLAQTDIAAHALAALAESTIERVHVVGRRGPIDVAFTIKELRELTKLDGCTPTIDPAAVAFSPEEREFIAGDRRKKRLVGLMETIANTTPNSETDERGGGGGGTNLVFHRTPVAVHGAATVEGVELEVNALEGPLDARLAVGTGVRETLGCGAVFRSIGYKAVPVDPSLPFDHQRGVIPNTEGRVESTPGLYCAGWIKTGPTGVIATTMANAYQTARSIAADLAAGILPKGGLPSSENPRDFYSELGPLVVTFEGWKAIEAGEIAAGVRKNKVAEKETSIEAMLSTAAAASEGVLQK